MQRKVGDGVFVVSTAPASSFVGGIDFATPPHVISKGEEYSPTVYGYNAYGLLINTEMSNYTITCDEQIGYVKADGKTFVADGIGLGKIYARTPAGYTCEMEVVVKEDINNIVFRLDSVVSDCHYEYPVEVSMTKSTGEVVPLNPSALSWSSSDEHVAFVENGVLKGLQNGMAEICGSISGVSDTLKVKVQEPSKHVLNINDGTPDWLKVSFTTSAGFKNTSVTNSEKEGLQISFLYNSTSAKTISLAGDIPLYSLPDTLRIHINPGEAKVKTFSCTLRLPSKKTVTVDLPIPEANKENICDIAFPDVLGDVFDIANYPLVLSHFTLGMDINTLGQNYRIDIPAVELVYNYYNENASDVQTIEGKSLDLSVSGRTILLGKAVDRVELYNVSGCLVSLTENSNHISAPGIGMYIVRIVTEGKVFSQKIWINR